MIVVLPRGFGSIVARRRLPGRADIVEGGCQGEAAVDFVIVPEADFLRSTPERVPVVGVMALVARCGCASITSAVEDSPHWDGALALWRCDCHSVEPQQRVQEELGPLGIVVTAPRGQRHCWRRGRRVHPW